MCKFSDVYHMDTGKTHLELSSWLHELTHNLTITQMFNYTSIIEFQTNIWIVTLSSNIYHEYTKLVKTNI